MTKVLEFIKRYRRDLVFAAIIFVLVTLSFGAGYLAGFKLNRTPIIIEACSER